VPYLTRVSLIRCKICQEEKDPALFQWRDQQGNTGVSKRCSSCRQRGWRRDPTLPAERYRIRRHAVERYRQRVQPELSYVQARDKMIRLMEKTELSLSSPWWHAGAQARPDEGLLAGYLLVADDVLFVIGRYPGDRQRGVAPRVKTVLTRGSLSKVGWYHLKSRWRRIINRARNNRY